MASTGNINLTVKGMITFELTFHHQTFFRVLCNTGRSLGTNKRKHHSRHPGSIDVQNSPCMPLPWHHTLFT